MKHPLIAGGLAAVLLTAPSCRQSASSVRQAVDQEERLYVQAMNEEHVDGLMAIYWNSPDLIVMSPSGTYRGADTVKQMWWNFFNVADIRKYAVTERHPIVAGDIAYEWGMYDFSYQVRGGPVVDAPGRYLLIWEKKDKHWVITAEHSSVPTPPPAVTNLAEADSR